MQTMLESNFSIEVSANRVQVKPLQSRFSTQVSAVAVSEPFPIVNRDSHDDRLFRHIAFPAEQDNVQLRLRTINTKDGTESTLTCKTVATNIAVTGAQHEVFRVKTVLLQPDHGVYESYWATQKRVDSEAVSAYNQYRIRGISKESWRSDWVYSNLRNSDGELIIHNMLHDILDLLLSVHEGEIESLIDTIAYDAYISILKEQVPDYMTVMELDDAKTASIRDIMNLSGNKGSMGQEESIVSSLGEGFAFIADSLKSTFAERIVASPSEFSSLVRTHKVLDRYASEKTDFIYLLLESFLDDCLGKIIQSSNIEAILQNEEENAVYIKGSYEFAIKRELITSLYDSSLSDAFVSHLDDAVQLISEPVIFENLIYGETEYVEKVLRYALMELYVPLVGIDKRFIDLMHEQDDEYEHQFSSSLSEYTLEKDSDILRNALLSDIFKTAIQGDILLEQEYEHRIIDVFLQKLIDSKKILVDYYFEEILSVLLDAGEAFRHEYSSIRCIQKENQKIQMKEDAILRADSLKTPKEEYLVKWQDKILSEFNTSPVHKKESFQVKWLDELIHHYMVASHQIHDEVKVLGEDEYYKLVKNYLYHSNRHLILDKNIVDIRHDLKDQFFMKEEELVQYTLGDFSGDATIGVFRLGVNTLKGEVSN